MLIIIPVLSWAGADLFIDNVKNFPMPKELVGGVVIPTTDNAQVNSLINPINQLFRGITYGHFFFTAVFIFIGFGVLSVVYGFLYSAVGPPRYSRFDARPIKATRRRR
ncbi:MAG: hypothetical protein JW726_11625 [Anaerolineales bacterium]|nr:hypothetical protein [Anaerolineales bacterium]